MIPHFVERLSEMLPKSSRRRMTLFFGDPRHVKSSASEEADAGKFFFPSRMQRSSSLGVGVQNHAESHCVNQREGCPRRDVCHWSQGLEPAFEG